MYDFAKKEKLMKCKFYGRGITAAWVIGDWDRGLAGRG
jgi:hypothetical protein